MITLPTPFSQEKYVIFINILLRILGQARELLDGMISTVNLGVKPAPGQVQIYFHNIMLGSDNFTGMEGYWTVNYTGTHSF